MNEPDIDIRDSVREHYAKVAEQDAGCCESDTSCGCRVSEQIGYSKEDLASLPEDAEMGLGCGNPISFAELKNGEAVLDLGSGGGVDCFLASRIVGVGGKVIGVDMTPGMISKARKNATRGNYQNVEFRLGEIEHLPAGDNTVDAVISNCVINLSPSKLEIYKEAYRVLKPGGRLAVADMVALQPLPDNLKNDLAAYTGCLAGAELVSQLEAWLTEAGFENVRIRVRQRSREFIQADFGEGKLDDCIASAHVTAFKPV
ncbi:MAG: arsenite methyltransferase [Verrucomicrobia bacterium]|nr:arsenite methyltransferase [Verrucomicrobiota bacterium]